MHGLCTVYAKTLLLVDLLDSLVMSISAAESQNEVNITMEPTDLLYLFEFSRIFKVGGIASPYATIEWSGVQTP